LSVGASSNFVDNGWFEIDKDGSWDVFAGSSFGEKGVEGIITAADCFVAWHLSVWLNSVLEAVKLPTGVSHLDTGLADMD